MLDDSGDFTNEDIMEVLDAQIEVGSKYKSHFFAMFSQLFCSIAEEVINRFGEKGKKAIEKAVETYGIERGKRIAKLVKSLGKNLTLKNFFIYGDLDSRSILKYKIKIVEGNIEILIRDCVFYKGCREWSKLEYGNIYCEHIDSAVLRGYNTDLGFGIRSNLTKGEKRCVLRYYEK